MSRASNIEIRAAILAEAEAQRPKDSGSTLQSSPVLEAVRNNLPPTTIDPELVIDRRDYIQGDCFKYTYFAINE